MPANSLPCAATSKSETCDPVGRVGVCVCLHLTSVIILKCSSSDGTRGQLLQLSSYFYTNTILHPELADKTLRTRGTAGAPVDLFTKQYLLLPFNDKYVLQVPVACTLA